MADLSDDDLMALFRGGEAEAFDVIFDRHRDMVYHFAVTMLREPEAAEEIMQESFLAVARSAGRYESRGRFRTWLLRIVRNRCLNRLEAVARRRAALAESGLSPEETPAPAADPQESMTQQEDLARVRAVIATLPERQREAIMLYAVEQLSYVEIGEVLNAPVNTVKTLIHRARATLAEQLG